jgi:hypothetical protein
VSFGYDIGGGGRRPFDGEHLRVGDDGTFELWLLSEAPVVGRFGGRLESATAAGLLGLASAATETFDAPLSPGAHAERWFAGSAATSFAAGRTPGGPWGELVSATRALRDQMASSPLAALSLSVADDWRSAVLRHVGPEVLPLTPVPLTVDVAAWEGYYDPVGTWSAPEGAAPVPSAGAASPGWSVVIPLDHGFEPVPGRVLHVKVGVTVRSDDGLARLVPTVAPEMAEPEATEGM